MQKHSWRRFHALKKGQILAMITKLTPMNLKGAVSMNPANKETKSMLQTVDTILLSLYYFVHLPNTIPKAMNIPEAKAAVDTE